MQHNVVAIDISHRANSSFEFHQFPPKLVLFFPTWYLSFSPPVGGRGGGRADSTSQVYD